VQNAAHVSPSEPDRAGAVKLLLNLIARRLQTGDPAATVDRLFSSQHVKDLQLIVAVAFTALVLVLLTGLPFFVWNEWLSPAPSSVQLVVQDKPVSAVPNSVPMVVEKKPESAAPSSGWAISLGRALVSGAAKFFVFLCPCSAL
jgi:hypothetical protein